MQNIDIDDLETQLTQAREMLSQRARELEDRDQNIVELEDELANVKLSKNQHLVDSLKQDKVAALEEEIQSLKKVIYYIQGMQV